MHSRGILLLLSLRCAMITADQHVENVAMGKAYSQSSKHYVQGPSSNAANGNTSGLYDANNCIHTLPGQQGTHWWQVDLGGTYPVYNITVWGRTGSNAGYWKTRLYPFTITVDGQTCVSVTSAASNRKNSVTCSSAMYGRVVRLNVTMPGRMLNLCEFQIFVNVAINKTYSQISTYPDNGAASNAADGNTTGFLGANTCSHTNGTPGVGLPSNVSHWWQVDLGKIYPVHNITVWARKEQNSAIFFDRLYPFMITVDSKTCVNVTSAPTTRSNSVTCSSVMYGQVVRLTLTKVNKMLNLCEFQIFVCKDGFYGLDCSSPCDKNCDEGCNMTSGFCTRCKEGLWGPELCHHNCSAHCAGPACQRDDGNCEECQPGFYGEGCSRACGYCQVNTTCHHQDGHCLAGCVSGFAEPLCLQVQVKQESWVVPVVGSLAAALLITIGVVAIMCWCRRSREDIEENQQRVAPPVEPESTQDRDRPSSASPISDADTTVYEIIDKDDAEKLHVQENNYESPHPYSNDDADRALYMQLSPPASDDASKVNIELS